MDYDAFDVIKIGAGISGLTAPALFSKAELRVQVLERHYLIGGYLQGFERKAFILSSYLIVIQALVKALLNVLKVLKRDKYKELAQLMEKD